MVTLSVDGALHARLAMLQRVLTIAIAFTAATLLTVPAIAGDVPDLAKTPGVAREDLAVTKICTIKWGTDARHVTAAMKQEVFERYGMSGNDAPQCVADAHGRRCEIDHLVSRELGGADDVNNLWPEPYGTTPWNAVLKDRVENRLHKEVCAHNISLEDARHQIVADWRKVYVTYFGKP